MGTLSYDERLARTLLDGEHDAIGAAVTLFERHDPPNLAAATALVSAYGTPTAGALERIERAYDMHRHVHDMPSD